MYLAATLAGFNAAHAIWSLSQKDGLIPWLSYTTNSGERKMIRYAGETVQAALGEARNAVRKNEMDYDDAVIVYDGRITINGKQSDAIILELFASFAFTARITIAIPYTPVSTGKFSVGRSEFVKYEDCVDFEKDTVINCFFEGVASHEEGAKTWKAHLDKNR